MSALYQDRWDKLTLQQRIQTIGNDTLKHPHFCRLGGVLVHGQIFLDDSVPTACTNGKDIKVGPAFFAPLNRKQARYLLFHELLHKFLKHHMPAYRSICIKYPDLSNMSMDFVINWLIETTPGAAQFVERPPGGALVDARFDGMSWMEVLRELLNMQNPNKPNGSNPNPNGKPSKGSSDPNAKRQEDVKGGPAISAQDALAGQGGFDEHDFPDFTDMSQDELAELEKKLDDAIEQGNIMHKKALAKLGSGGSFDAIAAERITDWRGPMQDFFTDACQGDDEGTYAPPNRRFQPLDLLMPSLYSNAMPELVVAGDTSGSMGPVYPVLFGEVANILRTVKPSKVHVLWWDTQVAAAQTFDESNYDDIAGLLAPAGGGGTSPQCVLDYIAANNIDPAAIVWLTDGYIDTLKTQPSCPSLWGVLDNERFTPPFGKVVHVSSVNL